MQQIELFDEWSRTALKDKMNEFLIELEDWQIVQVGIDFHQGFTGFIRYVKDE